MSTPGGLDFVDMIDHGLENNRGYGCILVVDDNFSKYGFGVSIKFKYSIW